MAESNALVAGDKGDGDDRAANTSSHRQRFLLAQVALADEIIRINDQDVSGQHLDGILTLVRRATDSSSSTLHIGFRRHFSGISPVLMSLGPHRRSGTELAIAVTMATADQQHLGRCIAEAAAQWYPKLRDKVLTFTANVDAASDADTADGGVAANTDPVMWAFHQIDEDIVRTSGAEPCDAAVLWQESRSRLGLTIWWTSRHSRRGAFSVCFALPLTLHFATLLSSHAHHDATNAHE